MLHLIYYTYYLTCWALRVRNMRRKLFSELEIQRIAFYYCKSVFPFIWRGMHLWMQYFILNETCLKLQRVMAFLIISLKMRRYRGYSEFNENKHAYRVENLYFISEVQLL